MRRSSCADPETHGVLPSMDKLATKAFVGLGANLGEPEAQVRRALAALAELPGTRLLAASSLYRSAPVGVVAQPDFINAVAAVETALTARALLDALLAEEKRFGRTREFPNAPRTLDLEDRKSTRLNSSHSQMSHAVFCLKKKSPRCVTSRHHRGSRGGDRDRLALGSPRPAQAGTRPLRPGRSLAGVPASVRPLARRTRAS